MSPQRPTDDGDAVLDVRGTRNALYKFTEQLQTLGFASAGESLEGHQHRWVRGLAQIDVLIPTNVGQRLSTLLGVSGGTTIETPGAQQALDRSEPVEVEVAGRAGFIRRPRLFGGLVVKAAAYTTNDDKKARHVIDFAVLATLAARRDFSGERISKKDRDYVANMLGVMGGKRELWAHMPGAEEGVERVRLAIKTDKTSPDPH